MRLLYHLAGQYLPRFGFLAPPPPKFGSGARISAARSVRNALTLPCKLEPYGFHATITRCLDHIQISFTLQSHDFDQSFATPAVVASLADRKGVILDNLVSFLQLSNQVHLSKTLDLESS